MIHCVLFVINFFNVSVASNMYLLKIFNFSHLPFLYHNCLNHIVKSHFQRLPKARPAPSPVDDRLEPLNVMKGLEPISEVSDPATDDLSGSGGSRSGSRRRPPTPKSRPETPVQVEVNNKNNILQEVVLFIIFIFACCNSRI